ncbi:MAG: aminopeptidase P family protein [Rhodothermaceae bacterium]|nr:aminopeptidase P family protein [Rhodothermaceae bacterium]
MFSPTTYTNRRRALAEAIPDGLILFLGNDSVPMNYPANVYRFRQDGSFLYYAGLDAPGLALTLDAETGEAILYGHDPTMADVIWEGPLQLLSERAAAAGITQTAPPEALADAIGAARALGRTIHMLPPYRGDQTLRLATLLGVRPGALVPSGVLIEAVIAQRLLKTDEELAEIEKAVALAGEMHRLAMQMAQPGRTEQKIAGAMEGYALAHGGYLSFPAIVSRRGEVLHNHPTDYVLQDGDLLLHDAGAHAPGSRYASDITRTSPVGGRFSERQRALYQIVLDAQEQAIAACAPGVAFREVHLLACRVIAEGLTTLGLMTGDPEEAVAAGAHALFIPHGLGHAMGLDVHDLEGLGEDRVGYGGEFQRSEQFGLAYLRFARRLEAGHVMTVEPGCYLIGPLMDQWRAEGQHTAFLDYEAIDQWRDVGGIRIEDDIAITADGYRLLGPPIPKAPEEVEATVQAGAELFASV